MPRATKRDIERSTQAHATDNPKVVAGRTTQRQKVGNYTTDSGQRAAFNATPGAFGKTEGDTRVVVKPNGDKPLGMSPEDTYWRSLGKQVRAGSVVTVRHPDRRNFRMA